MPAPYSTFILQASLTPAVIPTAGMARQSFSLPGVLAGDIVGLVQQPAPGGSRCGALQAAPTANDTIGIDFVALANNVTPAAGLYTFVVYRA